MADKVCAQRRTKNYPNVYTKAELIAIAKERGLKMKDIRGLNKEALCNRLNLGWAKPAKISKKKVLIKPERDASKLLGGRGCDVRKSKRLYPNAYSKPELVALVVKFLGLKKTAANRLSKGELCRLLSENEKFKASLTKGKGKGKKKEKGKGKKKAVRKKSKGNCIERSKLPLHPHQKAVVDFLMKKSNRGAIAAHSVGSGKTLTAITASQCLLDKHPDWTVIVVTPTSLQHNFKKEMVRYGADPDDDRYEFLTIRLFADKYGEKNIKDGQYKRSELIRSADLYKIKNPKSLKSKKLREEIAKEMNKKNKCPKNTFLIIDEAHNLRTEYNKTLKTSRVRAAIRCAMTVDKVLLLTATPLYNKPLDVANLVAMVEGKRPVTQKLFDAMIKNPNSAQFREYFKCFFSFYGIPKDTEDYPKTKHHVEHIIMSKKYFGEYMPVEKKTDAEKKFGDNPNAFLMGVRQATNALTPCQKCTRAMELIREGDKTLLFSQFKTHGINIIKDKLEKEGFEYTQIDGSMTKKDRSTAVREFNAEGGPNILLITQAGAEGLDLKGVRKVIILERGWNKPGTDQVIGRAVRYHSHTHLPKKQQKVDIYHLVLLKRDSKKPRPKWVSEVNSKKKSADGRLEELIREKDKEIRAFERNLKRMMEKREC